MYCLCTQQIFIEWKIPSINLVLPTHSIGIKIQTSVKIHEGANRDLTCSRSSSCGQQQEQVVGVVAGTRTSGAWSLEDDTSSRACDKSSSSMALTAIPAPRRASPAGHGRTPLPASLSVQHGFDLWQWVGVREMVRTRMAGWKWRTRRTERNWSSKSYVSSNTTKGRWRSEWRPLKLQVDLSYSHLENNLKQD
jgi:hypothetical protein